ncbi:hypothetical protein GCM10027051_31600 [Niabella terrae]
MPSVEYEQAIKHPSTLTVRGYDEMMLQAKAAKVIAETHSLNPERIYRWANFHGIALYEKLYILQNRKAYGSILHCLVYDIKMQFT